MRSKVFTRTVILLSFLSFFTDIASEMLYPVMPIYLQSIGFTALWIGILEGIAEAVVGLSKGYFGKWSDIKGKRLPFVQWGYALSAISKPMLAASANAIWILFSRSTDRLGKGIRTGARDAMLADACSKENKGKVFGFHRAMDTMGAAVGPVLAMIYLHFNQGGYKLLFLLAFIPGMIGVAISFFIRERQPIPAGNKSAGGFFSYFSYWKQASNSYRKLVKGLLLFTLFNSSDVFLLLLAKNAGMDDVHIIGVYVFYNLVYALFAFPMGYLADKLGMRKTFILGLVLFSTVYAGMAFLQNIPMLYGLFFIYGLYAASTEGIAKAWISITAPIQTATAIGFYSSASSIITMLASTLTGLIWVSFSPQLSFFVSATGVCGVIIYFIRNKEG